MNKILVAIDGAQHSEKTLMSAAEIARNENSELLILYACSQGAPNERQLSYAEKAFGRKFLKLVNGGELPTFSVSDSDGIKSISEYMKAREKLCKGFGTDVLERAATIAKNAGVKSVSTRIEQGDVTKTILDVAKTETADKIVVGNCTKSNWAQFFTGCTAKDIMKKAHCTAVIVE
jgi:nucleotide-binding universal stress UspA family protein